MSGLMSRGFIYFICNFLYFSIFRDVFISEIMRLIITHLDHSSYSFISWTCWDNWIIWVICVCPEKEVVFVLCIRRVHVYDERGLISYIIRFFSQNSSSLLTLECFIKEICIPWFWSLVLFFFLIVHTFNLVYENSLVTKVLFLVFLLTFYETLLIFISVSYYVDYSTGFVTSFSFTIDM